MFITPVACNLWFGCYFPASLFWDEGSNRFTAEFQNHLTESFKADIRADIGDEPFTGNSLCEDEAEVVYIIDELQKIFTVKVDVYKGLKVKSIFIPQFDEEPVEAIIFGWPLVDLSTNPLTLLHFDDNLEIRLRHFFLPNISGCSLPVLLNMERCTDGE